jgi:hypothetical protein
MAATGTQPGVQAGDRVQTRHRRGQPAREGEIIEVLGAPGHERYRVRWDERHESILYPTDGVSIIAHHAPKQRRASR